MNKATGMTFMDCEKFKSYTIFSVADICDRTGVTRQVANNAVEQMLSDGVVCVVGKDREGRQRYIRANQASKILREKWRQGNVGELAYYKGFHWFGNANTNWRGSL